MKKQSLIMLAAIAALSLSLAGCGSTSASAPSATVPNQAVAPQTAAPQTLPREITPPAPVQTLSTPSASDAISGASLSAPEGSISESQALEIACAHAGLKPEDILRSRVKLEIDHGIHKYYVHLFAQGKDYNYNILASTGEILSYDYEMENHVRLEQGESAPAGSITIEQAQQLALSQVPGAEPSHIRIKTDIDHGRTIYEGKIIYNNLKYEFEIDAATGTILEWDSESVFD